MVKLAKETIQRLAVLRALALWRNGAFGPVRLQKTLFYADKNNDPRKRIFTFKKYYLGQYSPEVSDALNALRSSGRLECVFDGPAERLKALVSAKVKTELERLFRSSFPRWESALPAVFDEWGYLSNDKILKKAHDDPSYTESQHDQVIFKSALADRIAVPGLDEETAEKWTDLVDPRLWTFLLDRMQNAAKAKVKATDWRQFFAEPA
jgi:hypothetical protein